MSNKFVVGDRVPEFTCTVRRDRPVRRASVVKSAALALVYVLAMSATPADATTISTKCFRSYGDFSCSTRIGIDPRDDAILWTDPVRIAKWEAFCRPTPVEGKDGLVRLTYAHEGCDMGRTE